MVRLLSPVESLGDPALVGLLSGFLDCLILLSPLYFPSLQGLFALLSLLEATAPHRLEPAASEEYLNKTA